MTREEAKTILEEVKMLDDSMYQYNPIYLEALDIAISALSEQKSPKERMEQLYLEESLKEDLENLIKENERLRNALSENKGEWIRFKDFEKGYFHIKCSKCGQYWSIDDHAKIFKYCFNCGADMRGE